LGSYYGAHAKTFFGGKMLKMETLPVESFYYYSELYLISSEKPIEKYLAFEHRD
jgi:hypothetical protein